MSLHPMAIPPVPAETARVARAALPKGNLYLKLRQRIGTIIYDEDFVYRVIVIVRQQFADSDPDCIPRNQSRSLVAGQKDLTY
jgi:hypothetical protein